MYFPGFHQVFTIDRSIKAIPVDAGDLSRIDPEKLLTEKVSPIKLNRSLLIDLNIQKTGRLQNLPSY